MDNQKISEHSILLLRIEALRKESIAQEADLKKSFRGLVLALNPITMAKASLHDLATDQEVHLDLAKVGLNVGANLVINQVLGKQRSAKGLVSSVLVEVISTALINNNASKIVLEMTKLFSPDPKQ